MNYKEMKENMEAMANENYQEWYYVKIMDK